ncbi:MAG TPA: hypothetical protein VGN63_15310 [Flavisolibacter sp.]|jgi:hypothetical protein|nr:hypothetical protein [Flavisolibacter sp.]
MQPTKTVKAGVLALVLTLLFIAAWELFWRSKGFLPTYNDDRALWAAERKEALQPARDATVFIGSSRIKFDLDIPEWERKTGEDAVQLSLVGTSPLLLLQDLGNDTAFRGKLVVDVTEVLFYGQNPAFHLSANEAVSYYQKQTPSEKLSDQLGFALEANLAFLEERRFSLNTLLESLALPNRPGVMALPVFPKGFEWTTGDRQTYMADMFLQSKEDIAFQTNVWKMLLMGDPTPPVEGEVLAKIFQEIKTATDKIKARGGRVIFVRTPSSGPLYEFEAAKYPREKYWDGMLRSTQNEGIHFADNQTTGGMICPEWSHLSRTDATIYTRELIAELRKKDWFSSSITIP